MKILIGLIVITSIIVFAFITNLRIPDETGLIGDKLASVPNSPNGVSSQTDDAKKYVKPLTLHGSVENSQEIIISILKNMGCTIVTRSKTYIHAVYSSDIFRFRDDLEFYFDESNGVIHFRSASRVGYSDLGANQKRYNMIAKSYNSH